MKSQLAAGKNIKAVTKGLDITSPEDLVLVKRAFLSKLRLLPLVGENIQRELQIRWSRTAEQILEDGFVYNTKACTDIVIVFLAIMRDLSVESKFVKAKSSSDLHSFAYIVIDNVGYYFDVSAQDALPIKTDGVNMLPYAGYSIVGVGKDSWDISYINDVVRK